MTVCREDSGDEGDDWDDAVDDGCRSGVKDVIPMMVIVFVYGWDVCSVGWLLPPLLVLLFSFCSVLTTLVLIDPLLFLMNYYVC